MLSIEKRPLQNHDVLELVLGGVQLVAIVLGNVHNRSGHKNNVQEQQNGSNPHGEEVVAFETHNFEVRHEIAIHLLVVSRKPDRLGAIERLEESDDG